MKINKILAAGIAATLAVTSLSAVASAEEITKTFDMVTTKGFVKFTLAGGNVGGELLGRNFYLTDAMFEGNANAGYANPVRLVSVPGAVALGQEEIKVAKQVQLQAQANYEDAVTNVERWVAAYNKGLTAADTKAVFSGVKTDGTFTITPATLDRDETTATINQKTTEVAEDGTKTVTEEEVEDLALGEVEQALTDAIAAFSGDDLKGVLITLPWTSDNAWWAGSNTWAKAHAYADYMDIAFLNESGVLTSGAKLQLVVKGVKGTRTASSKDYKYNLVDLKNGLYRLYIYEGTAPKGANEGDEGFLPEQFLEITEINIEFNYNKEYATDDEDDYNYWENGKTMPTAAGTGTELQGKPPVNPGNDELLTLIYKKLCNRGGVWAFADKYTKSIYAFLERTENDLDDNEIIKRWEVKPLSASNATQALTLKINNGTAYAYDFNQTYNEVKSEKVGTNPNAFGGLSSQMADFFNKRTNGKVTFYFKDVAETTSAWVHGGIPSTEVGLKTALSGTLMALFINYDHSTGALQSDMGVVDAENCTITFDISNALDDMGGLTKGNIHEIYYGLMGGINYKSWDYVSAHAASSAAEKTALTALKDYTGNPYDGDTLWYSTADNGKFAVGYMVEKVVLSYDDATDDVSGNTDEDDEPVTDDEPIDDEPIDDEPIDDEPIDDEPIDDEPIDDEPVDDEPVDDEPDDVPEIIDEPTVDDTPADDNNGIDLVTGDDDDANPGTGAALAVIPALIAAAGIAVSKKRK